jgi:hypothetical protein
MNRKKKEDTIQQCLDYRSFDVIFLLAIPGFELSTSCWLAGAFPLEPLQQF